jgi:hypothetical protein
VFHLSTSTFWQAKEPSFVFASSFSHSLKALCCIILSCLVLLPPCQSRWKGSTKVSNTFPKFLVLPLSFSLFVYVCLFAIPLDCFLFYGFDHLELKWELGVVVVVKEREIEIGYPTDVKHVAHIGLDGTSGSAPSWVCAICYVFWFYILIFKW